MGKNIVSIEDRIPKLKEARKKKANRRLITYLTIFFVLISIVIYLQTPLSHVKTITVKGNEQLEQEAIVQLSGVTTDMNMWSIDPKDVAQSIEKNAEIKSAQVDRKLPSTVAIQVHEFNRVGYMPEQSNYVPVLESGTILKEQAITRPGGDAPLLLGFNDPKILLEMAQELKALPSNIRDLISEIHWKPTEGNTTKLRLYMTDGFVVDGTIRNFSERMQVYPSIVAQLDPDAKGIVHIGVGAYFESFDQAPQEMEEEAETGE
ncbi:Cell division protein DivIB [Lentibacillus sp. JNUCC-1]|uniref:cell division protein FtsQ/DivIB n=1 Tax=Lentibacillus sp. JNUCC-1 TaxID=2654513 RepID=UPI0012E7B534|nr:FtsQ-type POTRA domain-containing protein [Lentibacillus sp. JNUCC-1]MUV36218.1 Cell division protein DivIB [Lentibacillus sp. JNUCC-1]